MSYERYNMLLKKRPKIDRTITPEQVEIAKEELHVLRIERELTGDIVTLVDTRINELEADSKITDDDRVRLTLTHSRILDRLEQQIRNDEFIVKLYDLEGTYAELSGRLAAITKEIESAREALYPIQNKTILN